MITANNVKYTAMQVIHNLALIESSNKSPDDAIFNMVTLPTVMIKHVAEQFNSDIWKVMAITNKQIPSAFMATKAIIERKDTGVQTAIQTAGMIMHPILAVAKEGLKDDNQTKAAKFIAKNGVLVVTAVYGELHKQGVSLEELQEASINFYIGATESSDIQSLKDSAQLLEYMEETKSTAKDVAVESYKKGTDMIGTISNTLKNEEFKAEAKEAAHEVKKAAKQFFKGLF